MITSGLGEASSQPARAVSAAPASARPHAWLYGRCTRCAMRETWEGARYACTGLRDDRCDHGRCPRPARHGSRCDRHRHSRSEGA